MLSSKRTTNIFCQSSLPWSIVKLRAISFTCEVETPTTVGRLGYRPEPAIVTSRWDIHI